MRAQRVIFCFMLALTALFPLTVTAHSVKGRVKVPLDEQAPTVDDFAYFIESYVTAHLFSDGEGGGSNRFFVKDFDRVELQDASATVHFRVFDKSGASVFPGSMSFKRSGRGVWRYTSGAGEVIPVYTYVTRSYYNYKTYVKPLAWIALGVGIVSLGFSVRRRYLNWKGLQASPPHP